MNFIIILFIILIILLCFKYNTIEKFSIDIYNNNRIINPHKNITVDIVIAHYKEDLSWVDGLNSSYNIYVYSKSSNSPNISRNYNHYILPNVGRCDHTYLYHIIKNYNILSDQTLFCTGSTRTIERKWLVFNHIINTLGKYHFYTSRLLRSSPQYEFFRLYYTNNTKYCASDPVNISDNCQLIKSKYKNLGDYERKNLNKGVIRYVTFYGVFSVSRENIQSYDIKIYKKLIKPLEIGDNLENGHFMERLWAHMFFDKK